MSYRRQTLEAEMKKAVELVLEDEAWQSAFEDFERMLLTNFAHGYVRAYAYRQLHPRRAALRLLRMLNAAAAAIAPEEDVQSAQRESGENNDDNNH